MDKRLSGADQSGNWPSLDEPGAANLEDEEASLDSITVADVHSNKMHDNSTDVVWWYTTASYNICTCTRLFSRVWTSKMILFHRKL